MTWLTILVCFATAVLSGLGVGSAGIFVVFLTTLGHFPQLAAQGLNLVFFLFSSGSALLVHMLKTPLLYGCILLLLLGGLPGCLLGARLANAMPQELLRRLFGIFLVLSGTLGLLKKKSAPRKTDK